MLFCLVSLLKLLPLLLFLVLFTVRHATNEWQVAYQRIAVIEWRSMAFSSSFSLGPTNDDDDDDSGTVSLW